MTLPSIDRARATGVGCVLAAAACLVGPLSAQSWDSSTLPAWPDEGPLTWEPRPTTPEISANDLRTRLYALAHDSMQGRRVGEPGNFKGTAYIAAEFARLGLEPAGDGGTWFQELPYGASAYDPAASRLSAGGAPLRLRADWIPIVPTPANGLGGRAALADAPTVFGGRWGESARLDPAVVRGKVVVFLSAPTAPGAYPPPPPAPLPGCDALPDQFGAAAIIRNEAAVNALRRRPPAPPPDRRAEEAGAAGVLVVGLDGMPAVMIAAAFAPSPGMDPGRPAAGLPGAIVSAAAAARLFGKPVDRLAVGAAGRRVTGAWSYAWRKSPTPARNVIGVLRGSNPARAGEYVLIGAHNDHLGTSGAAFDHDSLRAVNAVTRRQGANDPPCAPTASQQRRIDSLIAKARSVRPPRRDSIFNGADDDGSGTAVLLEIAERFAGERPARSIVFISHNAEEGGLEGSEWFTEHPTVPLAAIVAAHNMDMVGKGRVEQVRFGGPNSVQTLGSRRLSRELGDIIDSVNAVRAEPMAIDRSWDVTQNPLNRFCRSDQVNYVRKNVPITYFSLGYAQDYHQVTDEPQYVDFEHSARFGRFVHDIVWAIAERAARPAIAGPDPAYPTC